MEYLVESSLERYTAEKSGFGMGYGWLGKVMENMARGQA